jgi:hypothetical protein
MTNLEKVMILKKDEVAISLKENDCPLNFGLTVHKACDERCSLCWEEDED